MVKQQLLRRPRGASPSTPHRAVLAALCLFAAAAPGCQIIGPGGELKTGCDPEVAGPVCELNTAYTCSEEGEWTAEPCGSSSPVCSEGACRAVVQVAAGGSTTCARLQDGTVWCWGQNDHGQCGVAPTPGQEVTAPVRVPLEFKAEDIAVAGDGGDAGGHACAALVSGEVWCWGHNLFGQAGALDPDGGEVARPRPIPGLAGAGHRRGLHAGPGRTCVLLDGLGAAGELVCWGLVDLTPEDRSGPDVVGAPSRVELPGDVTAASLGARHTCAIAGGRVLCWGAGEGIDCGGAVTWRELDVPGAAAVATGDEHTCAATGSGVLCWGKDASGQVTGGAGEAECRTEPVSVAQVEASESDPLLGLFAGARHACALRSSGALACWGDNDHLQVAPKALPAASILEPVALALGNAHTCILPRAGNVRCWGSNRFGQLGQPRGEGVHCGKGVLDSDLCAETPVGVKWAD